MKRTLALIIFFLFTNCNQLAVSNFDIQFDMLPKGCEATVHDASVDQSPSTSQLYKFEINSINYLPQSVGPECVISKGITSITAADQCFASAKPNCAYWFDLGLNLAQAGSLNPADVKDGDWNIRINMSYLSRIFLNTINDGNFTYLIEVLEIYVMSGTEYIPVGVLYGDDFSREIPPVMQRNITFERSIHLSNNQSVSSIRLKHSRRCNKAGAALSEPVILKDVFTGYSFNSIEFVKIPKP